MSSLEFIKGRLDRPKGLVDVILDTDTFNEIDDQFALAYMLKSPDKFNIKAITAAPFHNKNLPDLTMEWKRAISR